MPQRRFRMKLLNFVLLTLALALSLFIAPSSMAQAKAQAPEKSAAATPAAVTEEKNLQAYIDLLRRDVREQKAEIMGSVMLLSAEDAATFWPIYTDYDDELTKLNNQRVENIKDYGRH